MAFSVEETTLISGGGLTRDYAGASDATRTFVARFDAKPTNWADVEAIIGVANGAYNPTAKTGGSLPSILSTLPGDTLGILRQLRRYKVKPTEDGTRLAFEFTAEYEQGELDPDPLNEKDILSFDGAKETEEYFMDEGDPPKPAVNTANEVFDKLPERTTGCFRLVIEGNRAWDEIDLALYASYLRPNATNDATTVIRGKTLGSGEGKMTGISVSPVLTPAGLLYGRVRWEVDAAPDWMDEFESRGFNEVGDGGSLREIVRGIPPVKVEKPWPLDVSGAAVEEASDPAYVVELQPYPMKDFSVFGWTTGA